MPAPANTKAKSLHWSFTLGVLLIVSFALTARSLLIGVAGSHNFHFNAIWLTEFVEAINRGEWRPRWMPGLYAGLGGPAFYFYSPLGFYLGALVEKVWPGDLGYLHATAWAVFITYFASGVAMFYWLRRQTGDLAALLAGVLYMLAPYHIVDNFVRGALGEVTAYPVLPLFALCLQRAAKDKLWVPLLGLSYAALMASHLAVALPVSLVAAPIYGLHLIWREPAGKRLGVLARCGVGAALGLALAATYIGPAMLMQKYSSMQIMWEGLYSGSDPASWTFLRYKTWPARPFSDMMALLALIYGLMGAAVLLSMRGLGKPVARDAAAWAWVAAASMAMYATPWIWHGPTGHVLSKIQFPFRMLVMMEFAAISAIFLGWAVGRRGRLALLLALPVVLLAIPVKQLVLPSYRNSLVVSGDADAVMKKTIDMRRGANEHLPPGLGWDPALPIDPQFMTGYESVPLVSLDAPDARLIAANAFPDGSVALEIDTPRPTRVVARRFYFVAWRATQVRPGKDPAFDVEPFGPSRFVSFVAPAGRHVYQLRVRPTPVERISDAISLGALLACAVFFATGALRRLQKRRKATI